MPKGQYIGKRGPRPAGAVSRNPATLREVYIDVKITRPTEQAGIEAMRRFTALTPDQRLAAVVAWNDNVTPA